MSGTCVLPDAICPLLVELSDRFAVGSDGPFPDAQLGSTRRGQGADVAPHVEVQLSDFLAMQENVVAGLRFADFATGPCFDQCDGFCHDFPVLWLVYIVRRRSEASRRRAS